MKSAVVSGTDADIFASLLMSAGITIVACASSSNNSLIVATLSRSCCSKLNGVTPLEAVRYVRLGSSDRYFLFLSSFNRGLLTCTRAPS